MPDDPVHYTAQAGLPEGMPLSAAVAYGGLLYISGLPGRDENGTIPPDFAGQFANIVRRMQGLLENAGAGIADLLEVAVLLTRASDVAEMNVLYRDAFGPAPFPARITSVVAALPNPDLLIEMRATARLQSPS